MDVRNPATKTVDLLVIGGGINGAGIARDAAGRGLEVLLCEKDDLASHTSSASTKLIHGGLRYLQQRDFRLVRHSLQEREVLLRNAPHIIWPLRFVLPHHAGLRPWWMIRLGLFLYDHLGGRALLPASTGVDLSRHVSGRVLRKRYQRAFEYSDCWVQDARLVVLNARDAHLRGAEVWTRTECVSLARRGASWEAMLVDGSAGTRFRVAARGVVNASGPWVGKTLELETGADTGHRVRLVKGSHIVVRRMFEHPYPYIFQGADGRVLFAIPFEEDYTLLGTTDVEIDEDPGPVAITPGEIDYICTAANAYFETPLSARDVVWSYSGIRPLFNDQAGNASAVTRDYVLHLDRGPAPMLSVYGGKITTYRRLAEQAVDLLARTSGLRSAGLDPRCSLPGGDIPNADVVGFTARSAERYFRGFRSGSSVTTCTTTAPRSMRSSPDATVSTISASISGRGCMRRRSSISSSTSGLGPRRISSGGVPRLGCGCPRMACAAFSRFSDTREMQQNESNAATARRTRERKRP